MKQVARLSLVGASIATSGCLLLGTAVASADSITNTGPGSRNVILSRLTSNSRVTNNNNVRITNSNYQTARTGDVNVSRNTSYHPGNCNDGYQNDWSSWSPDSWQQNGRNFGDWWAGMMSHMGQQYWSGGNNDWMNGGDSWSSWNPSMWCQNGSSYGNWLSKFNAYMSRNCNYWQQNWRPTAYHNVSYAKPSVEHKKSYGGYGSSYAPVYRSSSFGGNATSGAATNVNRTQSEVTITNNTPSSYSQQQAYPTYTSSNDTIRNTGPRSFNSIDTRSSRNTQVTNTNNVTISNTNDQTAFSGDVNVSGNTRGGSATSGDATNANSTRFDVAITNN